jgi:hypothetical protein
MNLINPDDHPRKILNYEALSENLSEAQVLHLQTEYLPETDVAVVLLDVSMPDGRSLPFSQRSG